MVEGFFAMLPFLKCQMGKIPINNVVFTQTMFVVGMVFLFH